MVDGPTIKERLWQLSERAGVQQMATWADVSEQAVGKWLKTGKITDENLRKLALHSKENYFDLKYGKEWREAAAHELGDEFPVDPVSLADCEDVFETLPPRYREIWTSIGKFMVGRYAPRSKKTPFSQVPPVSAPKRKA